MLQDDGARPLKSTGYPVRLCHLIRWKSRRSLVLLLLYAFFFSEFFLVHVHIFLIRASFVPPSLFQLCTQSFYAMFGCVSF